jgi:hypothetical protein
MPERTGVAIGVTRAPFERGPEGVPDGVDLCRVAGGVVWRGDGGDLVGQRDGFGGPQGRQRGVGVAAAEFGVGQDGQVPGCAVAFSQSARSVARAWSVCSRCA